MKLWAKMVFEQSVLKHKKYRMAYYLRENVRTRPVFGHRRPTINEFFLSSYTLSTYSGCEFGCAYCDAWSYGLRPLNETIRIPIDLPDVVNEELPGLDRGDLIAITALSDSYQPAEQTFRITRQVLQSFADHGQPCLILTKSPTVLEDLPLLRRINEQSLAVVMFTILTMDNYLSEQLEGKVQSPAARIEAMAELKRAGIPVGAAILPVMPYVNDTDLGLRTLLRSLASVPVDFVVWDFLHIPNERHRGRIRDTLGRIGSYPPSYYRDIYREQQLPIPSYRAERSRELLERCDALGIDVRMPHKLFAGKLKPANEAALILKHTAFRDEIQGRHTLALLHRELADQIYAGHYPKKELLSSPLASTVQAILERPEAAS